jgi:hypothetical protein
LRSQAAAEEGSSLMDLCLIDSVFIELGFDTAPWVPTMSLTFIVIDYLLIFIM